MFPLTSAQSNFTTTEFTEFETENKSQQVGRYGKKICIITMFDVLVLQGSIKAANMFVLF